MALSQSIVGISVCLVVLLSCVNTVSAWKGNIEPYGRWERTICRRCLCRYSWGCSLWRSYRCCRWITSYRCKNGWRHTGDKNCNVPICYPGCNEGTCVRPNTCVCPTTSTGQFCQTLTCSYERPCYPGNCMNINKCNCTTGFETPTTGCTKMTAVYEPYIGQSTAIISNIRRVDNKLIYYFQLDADSENGSIDVWSNQNQFNDLSFMFESKFEQPEEIPARPAYVHEVGLGIVSGKVTIGVTDYKGDPVDRARQNTDCEGAQFFNPEVGVYNCTISGQVFRTNMEHGDTLKVTFSVTSGGFRQMINLDENGEFLPIDQISGPSATKEIMFRFDLIAPKHCSEANSTVVCKTDEDVLAAQAEFTKDPIEVSWKGWYDDQYGAGMWQYYLELHRLVVRDATQDLTESDPIGPMEDALVMHEDNKVMTHTFNSTEPGVYSVLIEARDKANNSRIARRIVTYDPESEITVQTAGPGLHVRSATAESGYTWQSANYNRVSGEATIDVSWEGYFRNERHETGNYLNKVRAFPPQFNDLKDDGILSANKFVDPALDDYHGSRTLSGIANIRGIVRFQYRTNATWIVKDPLSESISIKRRVANGGFVQIWVRAEDMMGNKRTDTTIVRIDTTKPSTSTANDSTLTLNDDSTESTFSYPSRIQFEAFDYESGVSSIMIQVLLHTTGKPEKAFNTTVPANFEDDPTATGCYTTRDPTLCFIKEQTVFLDNCWFMTPTKSELHNATAKVNLIASNQAGLTSTLSFTIDKVASLHGLDATDDYDRNPRIENPTATSFRVVWDLPERQSCYGRADVILVLGLLDSEGRIYFVTHEISSTTTYFDVAGLNPDTTYDVIFKTKLGGGGTTADLKLTALTAKLEEETNYTPVIVGVVVGILVIIVLVIVLLVVLIRRGVIHPPERVTRVQRAVTKRVRNTFYGGATAAVPGHEMKGHSNKTYDNNTDHDLEELYIYGGMDLDDQQMWHLNRADIVFESLIKSGHFANIYKAKIHNYPDVVAVKTLKEKHTPADELLMKAKINFTGSRVGTHPNVLKFVGAIMSDDTMGPMIIYEYCENGTLKEYLENHRDDVTIQLQEHLFRFGLDIAKGMEYLAGQGITHKRLAARNILLTFLNEAKIAGFGPQPVEDEEMGESGKRERIPIKWMAPECTKTSKDATEKSDVWSYGVLLWEIFSLGSTPYGNTKARDIPGKLRKGERLGKPEQCDDVWYGVMQRCWSYDAPSRPTFTDIRSELDTLFVSSGDNEDYYYYRR